MSAYAGLRRRATTTLRGHEISTSFSIGIALCPHDANDSEALIRNADCAMYEAKTHGRNTHRFYKPSLQQRGARLLTLETALQCLSEWRQNGIVGTDFHVGINVAPPQFWHPDFARRTLDMVDRLLPNAPGALELELTESCLLRPNEDIQRTFATLSQAGVRFAVEDFGTGYSSLSYLKQFPLDVLKINQSFVRDCIDDPSDATIIRAIIAMVRGLGLEVIAGDVETREQAGFLKEAGCYLLQGYLLAKPMPMPMPAVNFVVFCKDFQHHPIASQR